MKDGLLPFPANPQPGELPFPVEGPRHAGDLERAAESRGSGVAEFKALSCLGLGEFVGPIKPARREVYFLARVSLKWVPATLKAAARFHRQDVDLVLRFQNVVDRIYFKLIAKYMTESDRAEIRALACRRVENLKEAGGDPCSCSE